MSERRRALAVVVALVAGLLSLVAMPAPAGATALERQADELAEQAADGPVRVLVTLDADSRREIAEVGADVVEAVEEDVDDVRTFDRRPVVAMEATAEAIEALAATDGVLGITEDAVLRPMLDQTVPLIGADDTTAAGFDGAGFNVAVLDTGVQSNHPFLTGKVVGEACFSYAGDCPGGGTSADGAGAGAPCTFNSSQCSHGTHVAGIAAGSQPAVLIGPTQGVAPGAGIVSVQIFSEEAGKSVTLSSDILAALDWVYDNRTTHHIAAVNLSLGTVETYTSTCDSLSQSRALDDVIDDLREVGIPTVVASGNDGKDAELAWPACMSNVVSVGASTDGDDVATYANVASFLSLLAPGSSVYSSVPGSSFGTKSGTSMATPHVAGAWAVVRDALAPATPSVTSVLAAMRATGLPIDGDVVDDLPRLDLAATLRPTAPRELQPSPGVEGVTVTWQAPVWSGASAITGYEVTASPAPTTGAATRTAAAEATSLLFDGLTDGVDYTFTVRALNDQGSGIAATTTPAGLADAPTAPDAPTGVTASAGDARATVSWTAPAANGAALTSYEVTVDPATDVTGGTTRSVAPTSTNLSFTGLTNGTAYTFTVVAVNAVGPSPASAPSTAVTPRRSTSSGGGGGGGGGSSSSGSTTTTTTPVVAVPTASVNRLAAADRVATAVEISRARFGAGEAAAVVLTTGSQFADALGGTPFAVAVGGPVLLTPSAGELADATRAEIRRVLAPGGTVHVLGGTGAVPAAAEDALRSDGFAVMRLAGGNRFETAVAVASARRAAPAAIFLADGRLFPDALAGGPAAAHLGGVVLLTDGAALPGVTADYLAAHPDVPVYALGGRAAAAAPTATAIAGADRYETAALVAQRFFESPAFAGVASGLSFADALGGGADAGARSGPLLLTRDGDLPSAVIDYLSARRSLVKTTSVYGGAAVVGDAVLWSMRTALGR